ncbi:DNA replication licensing factor mcm5-B-like [Artemia franciscana]
MATGFDFADVMSLSIPEETRAVKNKFSSFLLEFHEGNFIYKYRDMLRRHYNLRQYFIEVSMEDIQSYDEDLADKLRKQPTEYIALLEEATKEVADDITRPRPIGEENVDDIQVIIKSEANPVPIRDIKSDQVSHLTKVTGICIAASGIRAKATSITIQCRSCRNVVPNLLIRPGLEGYNLPRRCNTEQVGRPPCSLDPYYIVPDKCKCVDFQVLKLQEAPDDIPQGEMPRHLQLYCDRQEALRNSGGFTSYLSATLRCFTSLRPNSTKTEMSDSGLMLRKPLKDGAF